MSESSLNTAISTLLRQSQGDPGPIDIKPCDTSGNNRVFVVNTGNGKIVAKWYYTSVTDHRDRLGAEWQFLSYGTGIGIACIPRPISCDSTARLALYEFIEGRKLRSDEIGHDEVAAAALFLNTLNDPRHCHKAAALPLASEACFSIADHFALVDRRLARLTAIQPATEIDREAVDFAAELACEWNRLKQQIAHKAKAASTPLTAALSQQDRCISPSDFGFHNALARPDGELCFIDFEYAGWDDPAKMAADFFCQPAVPVDPRYFDWFLDETLGRRTNGAALKARAILLRPVFQTKWCCIMLNAFIPELAQRSRFANPGLDELQHKRIQLDKAKAAFQPTTRQ